MERNFNPTDFDLGTAIINLCLDNNKYKLYINDCNEIFTGFTGLKADKHKDVLESAFKSNKTNYISDLMELESNKKKGSLILQFHKTKKWLFSKILANGNGDFDLICDDYTDRQNSMNFFKFQKIGYQHYVENFHGLAFQRMLKPEVKSIFTTGAYSEITGYFADQAKDYKTWSEIIHPDDKDRIKKEANDLYEIAGYKKELEYRIIRKDGEIRWIHSFDCNILSEDHTMQMVQGLMVDITDSKNQELALEKANKKINQQNRKLKELSMTDPLTGLANRRFMHKALNYSINDSQRTKQPFSLLMFDLDHFKKINDKYGHDAGDLILCSISEILKNNLRQIDIIARWGGEEFLILFPHTQKEGAKKISEKLLNLVGNYKFNYKSSTIHVTFSGGIASYQESISLQSILHDADKALYKAKENGRNQIVSRR